MKKVIPIFMVVLSTISIVLNLALVIFIGISAAANSVVLFAFTVPMLTIGTILAFVLTAMNVLFKKDKLCFISLILNIIADIMLLISFGIMVGF